MHDPSRVRSREYDPNNPDSPRDIHSALVSTIVNWQGLREPLPLPQDGSPLQSLNAAHPALGVMNGVASTILQSEELLLAACKLSKADSLTYPFAVYPMARSSIELSAAVCWMLSPEESSEQGVRHILLQLDELKYLIPRAEGHAESSWLTLFKQKKQELDSLLPDLRGNRTPMTRLSGRGDLVKQFDELFDPEGSTGVNFHFMWSAYSGLVHGSSVMRSFLSLPGIDRGSGIIAAQKDQLQADSAVLIAAWALGRAHASYERAAGLEMGLRIPSVTFASEEMRARGSRGREDSSAS